MRNAAKFLALLVLSVLFVRSSFAAAGNLSAFAAPTATPTPIGANCTVAIVDTALPANSSTSGIVTVPVAGAHAVSATLSSPLANNTVQVNGVTPSGFTGLASGATITKTVDVTGLWTFVVTTPGCAPNSVSVLGY